MAILVRVCVKIPNANRQIPGDRIYLIKFCNSSHKYLPIALNNEFFTHIFHTEKKSGFTCKCDFFVCSLQANYRWTAKRGKKRSV